MREPAAGEGSIPPEAASAHAPSAGLLIAAAVAALLCFRALGASYADGFVLDLGKLGFPAPRYAAFLMSWSVFGTFAVVLATWGTIRMATREGAAAEFAAGWLRTDDRRWITVAVCLAMLFALMIRMAVLHGARLTDDESGYLFMAQLIARGRLSIASHPMPEFFDNAFMVNDGRFYAKYFVGWPLLLAPGAALGVPGVVNPILFGLTVVPLYRILQHHVGTGWARAGVVLTITAPMLLIGAATLLSHTSCMCALAWAYYALLRCLRAEARWTAHAGFAAALALACLIRPTSALGIGVPLALCWLWSLRGRPRKAWLPAVACFGAVAAAALAGLLAINLAQTGDAFTLAYQRELHFMAERGYRFSALPEEYRHLQFDDPGQALATTATALLRLSYALFGWPIGLALAALAFAFRPARLAWGAALGFVVVHLPITDPGIDSFGPVHYYEIALPAIVLCTLGLARADDFLRGLPIATGRLVAPALAVALVATSWLGYVPVRVMAVARMVEDILAPEDAAERAALHQAVVFSPHPFGGMCRGRPTQNFVFFRPNNDPGLENDILWVNHRGLREDRELMKHFPSREGFLIARFADCRVRALALDEVPPELAEPPPE